MTIAISKEACGSARIWVVVAAAGEIVGDEAAGAALTEDKSDSASSK